MGEVFAGFVCGFFLSVVSAPFLAATLLRMRASSPVLARMLPEGVNAVSVTMLLHFSLFFFWTGTGILLGLVLYALRDVDGIAGLPNPPYTLLVFSLVLAIAAPFAAFITPWRRQIVAAAILAFLVFGWLMPYLAGWSKFEERPNETNREHVAPTTAQIQYPAGG